MAGLAISAMPCYSAYGDVPFEVVGGGASVSRKKREILEGLSKNYKLPIDLSEDGKELVSKPSEAETGVGRKKREIFEGLSKYYKLPTDRPEDQEAKGKMNRILLEKLGKDYLMPKDFPEEQDGVSKGRSGLLTDMMDAYAESEAEVDVNKQTRRGLLSALMDSCEKRDDDIQDQTVLEQKLDLVMGDRDRIAAEAEEYREQNKELTRQVEELKQQLETARMNTAEDVEQRAKALAANRIRELDQVIESALAMVEELRRKLEEARAVTAQESS